MGENEKEKSPVDFFLGESDKDFHPVDENPDERESGMTSWAMHQGWILFLNYK